MVACGSQGNPMNWALSIGIFLVSTVPLFAQDQPDPAKLKAGAQKVVSIISGDKGKTQAYCQINDLGGQIGEAHEHQDNKKAEALSQKVIELEKKLGPEYVALVDGLKNWTQIPRKVLRSVRYSRHSTTPVRMNSYPSPTK